jgi:hypothetical protein
VEGLSGVRSVHIKKFSVSKKINISKLASVEFAQKANHGQNSRGHALRSGAMPGKDLLDLVTEQFQWSALLTCLGYVALSHHRKKA